MDATPSSRSTPSRERAVEPPAAGPRTDAPEVSFLIPAHNCAPFLERTVTAIVEFLGQRYPGRAEVLIVPNGEVAGDPRACGPLAGELARRHDAVAVCEHSGTPGKGAALRSGVRQARGRWIFFTDADLPYELEFFERAAAELSAGAELVSGNRRLPGSSALVPFELLAGLQRRHRMGAWFNRAIRVLLPIGSSDTQAGVKAMTADFARAAFERIACPGFLYDIELFLIAATQGRKHVELPVVLHVHDNPSTVRVVRETLRVALWTLRIALRYRRGAYARSG